MIRNNYKYPLYRKMILYITILVVFLILILSFVTYFNFESILLDIQCKSNQNIISEISYSAKYLDETARNLAAYIYSNNDYSPLRYSSINDEQYTQDTYNLITGIEALVTNSSNVQSVYIYNGNLDRFYSTWWRFYSDSDEFMDQDIAELIKNNRLPQNKLFTSTPILRKVPLKIKYGPNQQYTNVLTYIMCDYYPGEKKIQSAIIINLSTQYLDGLMDILNTKGALKGSETFILNENGQAVASSNPSSIFMDLNQKSYVKRVLGSQEESGYFSDIINDQKVVVTYVSSDVLDWKFVNVTPYSEIFKSINKMKMNTYLLCLGILIFGLPLAYLLARYLYSPIRNMMGKVEQLSHTTIQKGSANEFDFFTDMLANTIEKDRSAQTIKHENDVAKKQIFLKQLLFDGNLDRQYVEQMLNKYEIDMDINGSYMVCKLCIDHYMDFSQKMSIEDQKLFRFAICNVANELVLECFKNQCFEVDDRSIVIILERGNQSEKEANASVSESIRSIQDWCDVNLHISLSAAICMNAACIWDIYGSYKFVSELSRYRLIYGHKSLLLPEMLTNIRMNAFEHPVALEQKLDEALNNGKFPEIIEIYNRIVEYIKEYSYDTISSYILYFSYLLFKKMNDLEVKGYEKISFDCNSFISEIISFETLDEISKKVIGLVRVITDTVEQKKFKRKNSLVEKVKNIIEEEYMDKSLCQDGVARRLSISRDYLGKIFREACSKSFADFLTDVRLQKAVELLNNQKESISEILEEIGWENKNYFYTTFKQKYGMTTSEYKGKCIG